MEERRASPRHALRPALAGRLIFPGIARPIYVAVLDVSASIVGLYLPRPPEQSETMFLELLEGPVALRRLFELRVFFVRSAADGGHLVGGALANSFTDAELDALLGARSSEPEVVKRTA